MKKTLKLRIVKFDGLLVVEQIENTVMTRLGQTTEHFNVRDRDLFVGYDWLAFAVQGKTADYKSFRDNAERDAYLQKVLGWISDEIFGGAGKLEVGKMCEVSDDGKAWIKRIYAGELAPEFGKGFLAQHCLCDAAFFSAKYARPLGAQPTIDGDVYTWEGE